MFLTQIKRPHRVTLNLVLRIHIIFGAKYPRATHKKRTLLPVCRSAPGHSQHSRFLKPGKPRLFGDRFLVLVRQSRLWQRLIPYTYCNEKAPVLLCACAKKDGGCDNILYCVRNKSLMIGVRFVQAFSQSHNRVWIGQCHPFPPVVNQPFLFPGAQNAADGIERGSGHFCEILA